MVWQLYLYCCSLKCYLPFFLQPHHIVDLNLCCNWMQFQNLFHKPDSPLHLIWFLFPTGRALHFLKFDSIIFIHVFWHMQSSGLYPIQYFVSVWLGWTVRVWISNQLCIHVILMPFSPHLILLLIRMSQGTSSKIKIYYICHIPHFTEEALQLKKERMLDWQDLFLTDPYSHPMLSSVHI